LQLKYRRTLVPYQEDYSMDCVNTVEDKRGDNFDVCGIFNIKL